MKQVNGAFWSYVRKHGDRSVYRCHLDRLNSSIELWKTNFPGIQPHYAVKANPHPIITTTLASLGCSFDCASLNEIKQILDMKSPGWATQTIPPWAITPPLYSSQSSILETRNPISEPPIIFANPIKMASHLRYAYHHGVRSMTVDCPEELDKIHKYHANPKVVLRIAVDDSKSICKFNSKFGLPPTPDNLQAFFDKYRGLYPIHDNLIGISFHVGSGCQSEDSYRDAIERSQYVFNYAQRYNLQLKMLDLGGGFVQNQPLLSRVSQTIQTSLQTWKTHEPQTYPQQIIAEPGRFLAKSVFDLYVKVTGKKRQGSTIKYYINDSLYGSFNGKIFDYATYEFEILRQTEVNLYPTQLPKDTGGNWQSPTYNSILFGATCDSLDVILENIAIPELEIGDYLCFKNMGAYTLAATSKFNGVPPPLVWVEPK